MFGLFCCQNAHDGKDVDDLCFDVAPTACADESFAPNWPHACRVIARDDNHENEPEESREKSDGAAEGSSSSRRQSPKRGSSKVFEETVRQKSPKRSSRNSGLQKRGDDLEEHTPNARSGERDPLILTDRSRSRVPSQVVKVKLVSVEHARVAALKERRAARIKQSKEWDRQYHVVKENLRKIVASIAITAKCGDPMPCGETQAAVSTPVGFPIMPESAESNEYSKYDYAPHRVEQADQVLEHRVRDDHCVPEDLPSNLEYIHPSDGQERWPVGMSTATMAEPAADINPIDDPISEPPVQVASSSAENITAMSGISGCDDPSRKCMQTSPRDRKSVV